MKAHGGQPAMGEVIEYYSPRQFKGFAAKWMPCSERGKIIEFEPLDARADELASASIFRNSWIFLAPPR
jgi:hypothetical protein